MNNRQPQRRLPCSITARTYTFVPLSRSAVKKSSARIPCTCDRRNSAHPGPSRLGAGSIPASLRIRHTVGGATMMPSPASSPWTRSAPGRLRAGAFPVSLVRVQRRQADRVDDRADPARLAQTARPGRRARQSRSGLRATTSSAPGASFSTADPAPATTAFFKVAIGARTIATRTLSRVRESFPYTVTNCSPDSGQASGLARRVPCEGRARLSRVCGDSPSRLLVASFHPSQV